MTLFDLRVVDTDDPDNYLGYLDGWSGLAAAVDRMAPAELHFTYPKRGKNVAQLRDKQVVAFLQDGKEGDSCRFVIRGREGNQVSDDILTDTYTFVTLWDALKDAVYMAPADTKTRTWTNFTAGEQLVEIMKAPQARGTFKWWGYQGLTFDAKKDTNGFDWPKIDSMEHQYGITIFEVWDWLIHNHWIEVSCTGGFLNAYIPDSRGRDLTAVTPPVTISQGRDLKDAPEQETFEGFVTDLYVIGGETEKTDGSLNPKLFRTVLSGVTGWGKREASWTVTGVQSTATLDQIGAQYLKGFGAPRSSRTYAIQISGEDLDRPIRTTTKVTTVVEQKWSQYLNLKPNPNTIQPQNVASDNVTGDLYMTQSDDTRDVLHISRYVNGVWVAQMLIPQGGHDTMFLVENTGGVPKMWFEYGVGSTPDNQWVKLPWTAAKTWTEAEVLNYKAAKPPRPTTASGYWMQGETFYNDVFYRLWGTPYNSNGSTRTPATPSRVEIIKGGKIVQNLDVSKLAYDSKGVPLQGRMEPEGATILLKDNKPYLMIGFALGNSGSITQQLYTYPLFTSTEEEVVTETRGRSGMPLPMLDYTISDYIGVGLADGQPAHKERVEVISASADAQNVGNYLITVGDWLDDRDSKLERLVQKYDGGSL